MRYFEALIPHIPNASSLALLGGSDATMLLARFPALPDEYLRFLTEIGHGDLGPLVLYSSPIAPAVVYSEARATSLEGIVLFGDDMQGYCYGFDLSDDGRVVEIDPRGVVDRTIEPSFGRFLRALLVANT